MTELQTPADNPEKAVVAAEPAIAAEDFQPDVAPAPVLITEQELRLGTAAALNRPGTPVRARRRHYPARSASYYEASLMSREGYRL